MSQRPIIMTKWGPILVDGKFVHHTDRNTARCTPNPGPSPTHAPPRWNGVSVASSWGDCEDQVANA